MKTKNKIPESRIELVAQMVYEAERAFVLDVEERLELNNCSNYLHWENLNENQKVVVKDKVAEILKGNSLLKVHTEWLENKKKHGWTYDEVENIEDKQSPTIVPYFMIPRKQRIKNDLFESLTKATNAALDVSERSPDALLWYCAGCKEPENIEPVELTGSGEEDDQAKKWDTEECIYCSDGTVYVLDQKSIDCILFLA